MKNVLCTSEMSEPSKPVEMSVKEWETFCADSAFAAIKKDPNNEVYIIRYWSTAMKRV